MSLRHAGSESTEDKKIPWRKQLLSKKHRMLTFETAMLLGKCFELENIKLALNYGGGSIAVQASCFCCEFMLNKR